MKLITWPLRLTRRFWLAARYWLGLGYSWHLAWIKAGY